MTGVERVADALEPFFSADDLASDLHRKAARAAITALMEVDERMIEAGVDKLHGSVGGSPYPVASDCFRAMLTAALEGE